MQSTRASATLPCAAPRRPNAKKLDKVPGGTNLAEPQKEARLATLRDALDYQPGIVMQDFLAAPTSRAWVFAARASRATR